MAQATLQDLFASADIQLQGARPWDIRVNDSRFFRAVLAGGSGMSWKTFLIFNATGAVAWATAVAMAGYSLAYSWGTLERWIGDSGLVALVVVVILGAIALMRARQERKP